MITAEPNIKKWCKLYRQRYGHDPPARLVELKVRNRASIAERTRDELTLRSIAAKIPAKVQPTLKAIAEKIAKRPYIRGNRKAHSITPQESWAILDEYDRGDKIAAICAKHSCTRRTVRMIARRAGRIGRVIVTKEIAK